jgi:hypothetical protein
MWFLHRKVILPTDNLIKQNWTGSKLCCFCDCKESIQHLFFDCPFVKNCSPYYLHDFRVGSTKKINNFFENWLKGIPKNELAQIMVGVCAVIYLDYLNTRNAFIFNKPKTHLFVQVTPMIVHRIRIWSCLQQEEQRIMGAIV